MSARAKQKTKAKRGKGFKHRASQKSNSAVPAAKKILQNTKKRVPNLTKEIKPLVRGPRKRKIIAQTDGPDRGKKIARTDVSTKDSHQTPKRIRRRRNQKTTAVSEVVNNLVFHCKCRKNNVAFLFRFVDPLFDAKFCRDQKTIFGKLFLPNRLLKKPSRPSSVVLPTKANQEHKRKVRSIS